MIISIQSKVVVLVMVGQLFDTICRTLTISLISRPKSHRERCSTLDFYGDTWGGYKLSIPHAFVYTYTTSSTQVASYTRFPLGTLFFSRRR
jgi:hypothetical protein